MTRRDRQQAIYQASGRRVRIAIVGYKALSRLIQSVIPLFSLRADIEVFEVALDGALTLGHELEQRGNVDVIITAGANAAILQSALSIPVVGISISGYDLLIAFKRAKEIANRVGLVIYREKIPELEEFKELLNIEISQRLYTSLDDAEECFRSLKADRFEVIVGSSLVVDLAEKSGIRGVLVYSTRTVKDSIEYAIQIGMIAVLESCRYENLNAVLRHLHEAVLSVDKRHRITALNPLMETIIGFDYADAINVPLEEILPDLSLASVLVSGEKEIGDVVQLGHRTFVINRIPIHEQGVLTGAMLTLQDALAIQKADTSIRSQRKPRNLSARYRFNHLVGNSPKLIRAIDSARRYAKTNSTILISGKSGTGKELFAQAIHNASSRANSPFVAINCAAFPEALLESELFGYEEGAFTGSRKGGKPGLFEIAHTGTIFLDEIGDMPIALQTRLLRVLQEREVIRVGGIQPISVDLRVIAATHQHIPDQIDRKLFRADLYYRLNILHFNLPCLSERQEDIPSLSLHLLNTYLRRLGSSLAADQALGPFMPLLMGYSWPGNVRELENIMERFSVFLSQYEDVRQIDYQAFQHEIPEIVLASGRRASLRPSPVAEAVPSGDVSLDDMRIALRQAKGNKGRAAELLGISRTTFWRKLRVSNSADNA